MALPLFNNGDSGTDETAVTTGNSGGNNGDAWDSVSNTAGGGGAVFDVGQGRWGAGCYRLDVGTAIGNVFLIWSTSLAGPISTLATRHYFKMSALPSSNLLIFQARGSAANRSLVRIQSSGIPQILNAASTSVHTFASALPTNKWIRMESLWTFSAAAGVARVEFWWDDTSTRTCDSIGTATLDSGTLTALALGGTDVDTINLGASAATAQTSAASHWIDEVSYRSTATLPIGPPTEMWRASGSAWTPLRSAKIVTGAWQGA